MARLAKSSISVARSKVGYAPLQALHERACVPLASARKPPHAFNAGLRLAAVDGSNFDVPDEAANAIALATPAAAPAMPPTHKRSAPCSSSASRQFAPQIFSGIAEEW